MAALQLGFAVGKRGLAWAAGGMMAGMLLWFSGLDVALQLWLYEVVPVGLDKAARGVSGLGLGRNQVVVCLLAGLGWAWYGTAWKAGAGVASLQVPRWVRGCVSQLALWLRGRRGWTADWQGVPAGPRALLLCVPVFAVAGVTNIALKLVVGRPRPKEILWNGWDAYLRLPMSDAGYMSLPSGHTATTAAMAVVLAAAFPRWRWVLVGWVVLVGMARVLSVTPHYLGDVVAGAGVGVGVALVLTARTGLAGKKAARRG